MEAFTAEFADVVARAFAIPDGAKALNAITVKACDLNLYSEFAAENMGIRYLVRELAARLNSEPDKVGAFIQALYTELPGSAELRLWVAAHAPDKAALVSEENFIAARADYENSRSAGLLRRAAVGGVEELLKGVQTDGAAALQKLAEAYSGQIDQAARQLNLVSCYKDFHDKLHTIQVLAFAQFGIMLLKSELDEADCAIVATHIQMIGNTLPAMRGYCARLVIANEKHDDAWIARLENAVRGFDVSAVTKPTLRALTMELRSILSSQLATYHAALAAAASRIPFASVARLLTEAADYVAETSANRMRTASSGIEALGLRLLNLVGIHDRWQRLEGSIWGIELALQGAAVIPEQRSDALILWQSDIQARLDKIIEIDPGNWSDPVKTNCSAVAAALESDASYLDLRRTFELFAQAARTRFYHVDLKLLEEAAGLTELLPSLQLLKQRTA